ncbi:hypothetical protein DINM_020804 [Dirofilaria immitis]|nr:hypothetical protein [Dirofilaria immitis]
MTKDARKGDDKIGESKNDDDNDDDDALLLSQAMDNGGMKDFDDQQTKKTPWRFAWRKSNVDVQSKNLNRENALLQDNLIQIHQTFEQKFLEQKSDFEKTERDMRNVITYQEQDLRTKEFRDRLNDSASIATGSNHAEKMLLYSGSREMDDVRHNSPSVRLKKSPYQVFDREALFHENRLFQFYGLCDEITKLDFHALSQELPRKHERKSTHIMRDILTESPKQWYR